MASLKDLRRRIASVKSTQKITKAMKMVAASKLRRAQEAAEAARPYAERMELVLASLAKGLLGREGAPRLLAGTGSEQKHLLIVATGERGLCGGFNSSIARAARDQARLLMAEGKEVKFLCVGKKGRDVLNREFGDQIIDTVYLTHVRNLSYADAAPVGERLLDMFDAGEFDVCTLYYNKFISVITQEVTTQRLIPAEIPEEAGDLKPNFGGAIYEFEPDEKEILETLLPRNLSVQILRAFFENAASEQGARMSAMDSATRNAGDMIDKLTLKYNRTRQAAITTELTEIISGAEAL